MYDDALVAAALEGEEQLRRVLRTDLGTENISLDALSEEECMQKCQPGEDYAGFTIRTYRQAETAENCARDHIDVVSFIRRNHALNYMVENGEWMEASSPSSSEYLIARKEESIWDFRTWEGVGNTLIVPCAAKTLVFYGHELRTDNAI